MKGNRSDHHALQRLHPGDRGGGRKGRKQRGRDGGVLVPVLYTRAERATARWDGTASAADEGRRGGVGRRVGEETGERRGLTLLSSSGPDSGGRFQIPFCFGTWDRYILPPSKYRARFSPLRDDQGGAAHAGLAINSPHGHI